MCTVSIIALKPSESLDASAGFRVVVNRDEERDRPPAHGPRWRDLACGARAVWPTDPLGGGTWIAASSRGLVLCLLNGNPEPRPPRPEAGRVLSRGVIVPGLIDAPDAQAALDRARGLELDRFPPFRLLAIDSGGPSLSGAGPRVLDCKWNGREAALGSRVGPAACFVSSGLGDRCVSVRLPLFERMVLPAPTPESQDLFHAHRWPERPELSVLMSRSAARTVSRTIVEAGAGGVSMRYETVDEPLGVPREGDASFRRVR